MPTAGKVHNPFGEADTSNTLSATGAQALIIENNLTIVDGVTTVATGSRTLNLTIDTDSVSAGAKIVIESKTTGTETLVFGTGITGVTLTGVAGKTFVMEAVYNGTVFEISGTPVQID
jgi:hypothetical protein